MPVTPSPIFKGLSFVTFRKTRSQLGRHHNLFSTLCLTQCDTPPPHLFEKSCCSCVPYRSYLKDSEFNFSFFITVPFLSKWQIRYRLILLKSSWKLRFKFRKWQVLLKTLSGRLNLQRNRSVFTPDANYNHKRSASRKNRDWTCFTWCTAVITGISKRAVWITDMIIVPTFVSISNLFTEGSKVGSNGFIE